MAPIFLIRMHKSSLYNSNCLTKIYNYEKIENVDIIGSNYLFGVLNSCTEDAEIFPKEELQTSGNGEGSNLI